MQSELARYFAAVRQSKGIRLGQLARMIGYRDAGKGASRIDRFEKWNRIHEGLLVKLAAALGIDNSIVASLIAEDRRRYLQDWELWVNTPIRPSIITGHIGGFCLSEPVPQGLTQEAAEEYAARVAKELNRPILLILSRRLSISFDRQGNREKATEATPASTVVPYLRMGRRHFTFDLGKTKPFGLSEMPRPEAVVTDFAGLRMLSTITDDEPNKFAVITEGPYLSTDEKPSLADCHIGLETVLIRHNVWLDLGELARLRDSLDFNAILGMLSGQDQIQQMLGKIEDELIAANVVTGPKRFQ